MTDLRKQLVEELQTGRLIPRSCQYNYGYGQEEVITVELTTSIGALSDNAIKQLQGYTGKVGNTRPDVLEAEAAGNRGAR